MTAWAGGAATPLGSALSGRRNIISFAAMDYTGSRLEPIMDRSAMDR